jgi:hypothetical protein
MTVLRRPLISVAALIVYLAINVGACGTHHHGPRSAAHDADPVARAGSCLSATDATADAGDHPCPICNVLHLAKSLPTGVEVTAVAGHTSSTTTAAALPLPHPLEAAIHSRGPPAA